MHSCPKHVEKNNKHIKKIFAPSWFCLQKIIQGCAVNRTYQSSSPYLPELQTRNFFLVCHLIIHGKIPAQNVFLTLCTVTV